jgi:hypothetical protein
VYILQTRLKLIKVAYKLKPTKYKGMIMQKVVTNNIYDVVAAVFLFGYNVNKPLFPAIPD